MINEHMPPGYKFKGPVTKKVLNRQLAKIGKEKPELYGQVVQKVKEFGDYVATYEGISVGLDDIAPDYSRRDPVLSEAKKKIRRMRSDKDRRKLISDTQAQVLETVKKHPGDMGLMARSGGRGSVAQLMKTVASPIASQGADGEVIPWMITHSYSEGLRPDEAWVANVEARRGAIATKESVAEPGAFGKILVSNMSGQVVVAADCDTHNGIMMSLDDPHVVDRYTAQDGHGIPAHTAVSPELVQQLKRKKINRLKVRSPMTCEIAEGVCQLCYGEDERGKLPQIGTNLGIRSAQAMAEPLTQFALNAKHGGRLAGAGENLSLRGLKGLQNFLEFPKSFTRKATLAPTAGTIKKVRQAPQGGHYVDLASGSATEEHYIAPGIGVSVRQGQRVAAGDALSRGVPMPNEVVRHKGLGAGRKHIADTVWDIYKSSGSDIDKRHAEILARSHLNYVRVTKDPGGTHSAGEIVPFNKLQTRFGEKTSTKAVDKARGEVLGKHTLHYTAGTKITPGVVATLKQEGIDTVPVYTGGLRVRPIVKPLTRNPLLDPSWMTRMGHRYLKRTILEGAAEGSTSSIHGVEPVPAYVFGSEFGLGTDGQY